MISIEILLPDGRKIPAKIRERSYRKLTMRLSNLTFWERLRVLFTPRKEVE
jgi:hypothetical protein